MKYKVEIITPERAQKLLIRTEQTGHTNRGLRRARIEKLAHAIECGQWQVTHEGLALADDGAVLDGQHRLHAIVLANKEVEMLVIREVEPASFAVLNTGAARTTGDSLKIAGFTDVNHLSASIRGYLAFDRLIGTTGSFRHTQGVITTAEVLEFLDDPDQRQVAQGVVSEASRVANGVARYGLKTTLAMSMMLVRLRKNDIGPTTVAEFYARLEDGVSLPADSPILALRRWFMHDTGYEKVPGEARRPVGCANIIKALNDYALGKPRSITVFRMGVEPYPAPLPVGSLLRLEAELEKQEGKHSGEPN